MVSLGLGWLSVVWSFLVVVVFFGDGFGSELSLDSGFTVFIEGFFKNLIEKLIFQSVDGRTVFGIVDDL